jgi:hypothetical protein
VELQTIESLKWLKFSHAGEDDLVVIVEQYNELARKFLLEGRVKAVLYLLET